MATYEFAVYNSEVRQLVAAGKQHAKYTPEWADMQYIEVTAFNEDQARGKFEEMHPSAEGFVVDDVMESG